jgi:hypothetical protein
MRGHARTRLLVFAQPNGRAIVPTQAVLSLLLNCRCSPRCHVHHILGLAVLHWQVQECKSLVTDSRGRACVQAD